MGNESSIGFIAVNDVKAQDLRAYYAGFCRRALPEGALWRLSQASSYLPENHVGYKVWLTMVAGTERFVPDLQAWAVALAPTIAVMRPKRGKHAYPYVKRYRHEWGKQAALDGVALAIMGQDNVASARSRAKEFDCDRDAYARIRGFVAGALIIAASQYETELRLVHREALN